MNSMDKILTMLPPDTKIVRFLTTEGGVEEDDVQDNVLNITGVEVYDLSSLAIPSVVACNIILNCFMACFGIDIASIAREEVASTDYRLVDMHNLLINSKWDDTDVTINGVTRKAMDWVKYRFSIYSKENFVNALYNRLNDLCLNGKNVSDGIVIETEDDTYQMIKFIACCYGADVGFSSIPLSEAIEVDFDGTSVRDMFDKIGEVLAENGYITNKNKFSYNAAWVDAINRGTGNPAIDVQTDADNPVFREPTYITLVIWKYPNSSICWGTGQYSSTLPYTLPYGNGETVWSYELFFHPTSRGKIKRIEYNVLGSGRSINSGRLYGTESTNSWFLTIDYSSIIFYNENEEVFTPINGNDHGGVIRPSRFYVMGYDNVVTSQSTMGLDPDVGDLEGFLSRNPNSEYLEKNWLPYYKSYTSSSDFEVADVTYLYPMMNGVGVIEAETVPSPNTDDTILDDIDDIDMIQSGWKKRLTLSVQALLEALKTRANFIDTTVSLKTDMIKTSTYKSIRTGEPLYQAHEDDELNYITQFGVGIPYENRSNKYNFQMSQRTYVLKELGQVNNFNSFLWSKDFMLKVVEALNKYTPLDCIEDVITLPFNIGNIHCDPNETLISCGGFPMTTQGIPSAPLIEAKGHLLHNYIKVLRTQVVRVGFDKVRKGNSEVVDMPVPDSYLNYEPYTNAKIYIPFVGERDLDMSMIMYKNIYLEYRVFIPTGDFVVSVYVYDSKDTLEGGTEAEYGVIGVEGENRAYPIVTASGNMAYHHKIAGRGTPNALQSISSGLGMIGSIASGNVPLAIGQALNGVSSLSGVNNIQSSGASLGNMGALLSNWRPYITIFKHEAIRGYTTDTNTAFNQTIGKKSERGIIIKHMGKGFHKVKGVRLEGLNAPSEVKDMLVRILEEGFYKASDPVPDGNVGE